MTRTCKYCGRPRSKHAHRCGECRSARWPQPVRFTCSECGGHRALKLSPQLCGDCSPPGTYAEASHRIRRAHASVQRAVRGGRLPSPKTQPCVDCSKPATEYDHRSYFEPLNVDPVCHSCNIKRGPGISVIATGGTVTRHELRPDIFGEKAEAA